MKFRLPAFSRKQLLIIVVGIVAIIIVLILIGRGNGVKKRPVSLEIWGVFDEYDSFKELLSEYQKENKHVSIRYIKKPITDYEEGLRDAFSIDKEPDIWMIHNTWLPKHKEKISKMPTVLMAEKMPFNIFRNSFVDVIEMDFTENEEIYALPHSVDTLAMFYNKDYFNSAGISFPPETWEELIDDLDKLIKKDQWRKIERAGVSLGTAKNIHRSTDILSLLMLQNGTDMVSGDKKYATFNQSINLGEGAYYPGQDALRFYTDFSNPSKRVYTWNRQMHYSVDSFIEGKTAIIFDYAYNLPLIRERAPYLNFDIATMPQIKDREFDVNYANYWAFTVSKYKSKTRDANTIDEAWKLIIYLTDKKNVKKYLEKTKRPTARRDLVEWQKNDLDLSVFAKQSLTARSWYQVDYDKVETILAEAIESVVLGNSSIKNAIDKAAHQISLEMRNKN